MKLPRRECKDKALQKISKATEILRSSERCDESKAEFEVRKQDDYRECKVIFCKLPHRRSAGQSVQLSLVAFRPT